MIALNNLRSQIKSITPQNKLPVIVNLASDCTHEEASFASSDDLGNFSILLDEDNDLKEEINHLFNEVIIYIFKFERKNNQPGSKYVQNMHLNTE